MTATIETVEQRKQRHAAFWRGEGPSLILVPTHDLATYQLDNYAAQFADPQVMWQAESNRARVMLDWPTDGIPTVRPNLGVVFVPSLAGQSYSAQDGQMPWPGEPLGPQQTLAAAGRDVAAQALMRRAVEFYRIYNAQRDPGLAAYAPDTQGVFDIAHLLYGDDIFLDMADPEEAKRVDDVLRVCLDYYVQATRAVKRAMNELDNEMVHGHGTAQGLYFPHAGVRCSEDTAQLISPQMIERFVLPSVEAASKPFGGCFVHFCGKHDQLFEKFCDAPHVRALDLGNPESYDPRWLLEHCARTDTVLYSRLPAQPGEDWRAYLTRLGTLVKSTGARCVLRANISPADRDEAAAMRDLWHELTD